MGVVSSMHTYPSVAMRPPQQFLRFASSQALHGLSLANGEMAARESPYSIFLEYLDKEANFYQVIKRAGDRRRARKGALNDGRLFAHQTLQPGQKQNEM
jgi:hypothetical protein